MISIRYVIVAFFIFFVPNILHAGEADIVINEIAAYESGDYEWIEIYNKGSGAVNVTGWKFYEAQANHKLTAYRGDLIIESGEYAVIANKADKVEQKYAGFTGTLIDSSWSTLSENGEEIGLKNANGDTIELFTYIQAKNAALERKDVALADYTVANWQEHADSNTVGTKNGNTSSQTNQQAQSQQQIQNSQSQTTNVSQGPRRILRGDVLINELVSDPPDREEEWVEIINMTSQTIMLDGWSLEDGGGGVVMLSGEIGTQEGKHYAIVSVSNGFLDNAGDMIVLRSAEGIIIDRVTYGVWDDGDLRDNASRAVDPFALARVGHSFYNRDDFRVTAAPTKGSANKIDKNVDHPTESAVSVVISELFPNPVSRDPRDEFIELYNPSDRPVTLTDWELETLAGLKYVFSVGDALAPGEYRAYQRSITNLPLRNTGGERIRLYAPDTAHAISEARYTENAPLNMSSAREGTGQFRWTKKPTPNEKNVIERDNEPPTVVINGPSAASPGDPLTFDASDTFDRDGDPLSFHWNFGDGVEVDGAHVRHTYSEEDAFPILLTVSDGVESVAQYHHIVIEDQSSSARLAQSVILASPGGGSASGGMMGTLKDSYSSSRQQGSGTEVSAALSGPGSAREPQSYISTPLNRIRSLKSGTAVRVEGAVAVVPGIISANYFYIAGSGIQIWNPKKEFPALERGDRIVVSGTVRKNGSEHAVRIVSADAIRVIAHEDDPIPFETSLSDIGESREGELVRVTARIADTRWPNVYLEDGDVRVRIYIARTTNIGKEQFHEGEEVAVTGIVSETSAGYRILPRDKDDVVSDGPSTEPAVLGEKVEGPQILTLPERADPRKELFKYFLVTLLATLVIVGALGYQYHLDHKKKK